VNRAEFHKFIWGWYKTHGRHDLPWRKKITPYRILVSEVMLQQTQVSRVIPKYQAWIKRWPTFRALSQAEKRDVLAMWQGLGYNSRALRLWQLAALVSEHNGRLPKDRKALEKLPGIGSYTSGAILAFAYNEPVAFIDTNIRRIFLHHFFPEQENVSDQVVLEKVLAMEPQEKSREWYWALMDYGAHLGVLLRAANPNRRSKSYAKQSRFVGSDREVRGAILRTLLTQPKPKAQLQKSIEKELGREIKNFDEILQSLITEELVRKQGKNLAI